MNVLRSVFATFVLVGCSLVAEPVFADPQNGWWWNPAEDGRGFFIERRDGFTFVGLYGYDADGRASWLVSGAPSADPYRYTGELYSMHDGQPLFGAYRKPAGPDVAGTLSIHFTDDSHGTLTWPGGTIPIERLVFGGESTIDQPFSGWWWNANEDGSGYSLEIQGEVLVIIGFMYDDTGAPAWYLSAGRMSSPTAYSGTLLHYANGQSMGGTYRRPTSVTIGTLDIAFAAVDEATLTFTETSSQTAKSLTTLKAGRSRGGAVKPLLPTRFKVPEYYVGWFRYEQRITGPAIDSTYIVEADARLDRMARGSRVKGLSYFAAVSGRLRTIHHAVSPFCDALGARTFTAADIVLPNALKLAVSPIGGYLVEMYLNLDPIPTVVTCDSGFGRTTTPDTAHLVGDDAVLNSADNVYLTIPVPGDDQLAGVSPGALHGSRTGGAAPLSTKFEFSFKPCFGTAPCSP